MSRGLAGLEAAILETPLKLFISAVESGCRLNLYESSIPPHVETQYFRQCYDQTSSDVYDTTKDTNDSIDARSSQEKELTVLPSEQKVPIPVGHFLYVSLTVGLQTNGNVHKRVGNH